MTAIEKLAHAEGWKLITQYRHYIILALIVASTALAVYATWIQGTHSVFTHLFYLPVILAALWYHLKAVYLSIALGLIHVSMGFCFTGHIVPDTLVRAAMFITVAAVIGMLSSARASLFDQVRSSEEDLRSVFDGISDAIFIHGLNGRVIEVNKRMLQMYGVTREQAPLLTIEHDYSGSASPLDRLDEIWRKANAGEDQVFDWIARKPGDGTTFWVEVSLGKIHYHDGEALLATVRDISRRKEAEKEVADARRRAELFVDLLGHDINNLNQAGMGYLEIALEEPHLDHGTRELIRKSLDAMKSSSALIGNVRKIQQAHEEKGLVETIDLGRLLDDIKAEFSKDTEKDVSIEYTPPQGCLIKASPLIREAFRNLLGNAVKYTDSPVKITIRLAPVTDNGRRFYKVDVEDNGPGIPDDLKQKLFTRKVRGRTDKAGTGLGLFLVRMLVDDSGGRVWVEDRVPGSQTEGSRFSLLLPALSDRQ